jgi:hypothetical protein
MADADKVGKAWARQCRNKENPVNCCFDKQLSCVNQFPSEYELCHSYGEACLSNVRDVGKAWATQCPSKENPIQCCYDKGQSCAEQFPKKKSLCNEYAQRCHELLSA